VAVVQLARSNVEELDDQVRHSMLALVLDKHINVD
jgi:hypothetical protein